MHLSEFVWHSTLRCVGCDDLRVSCVDSQGDGRRFWEFPFDLYRHDPNWVPPLRRYERDRWRPERNPALHGRECRRYLARRGGRIVGRVAAIVDPLFEMRWAARCGFFGFFECVNDLSVAAALGQAVENDLRACGKQHMLGPVNLTTHDEVGTLVDGFDRPTVLTPYNPSYYLRLFVHAGLSPQQTYHAYQWTSEVAPSRAIERMLRRLRVDPALRVRAANPKQWKQEVAILGALYNACFADVWGFVPMCPEEFEYKAGAFRSFYRPELVLIAEDAGRPIGFAVLLPDINEALQKTNGRLFPWGWLHIARRMRSIRRARFVLLGVLPAYAGRGVAALLAQQAHLATQRLGIQEVELSLVHEANQRVRHVVSAFGGRVSKTYCLFGKRLIVEPACQPGIILRC